MSSSLYSTIITSSQAIRYSISSFDAFVSGFTTSSPSNRSLKASSEPLVRHLTASDRLIIPYFGSSSHPPFRYYPSLTIRYPLSTTLSFSFIPRFYARSPLSFTQVPSKLTRTPFFPLHLGPIRIRIAPASLVLTQPINGTRLAIPPDEYDSR